MTTATCWTLSAIVEENRNVGQHYFDKGTLQFFGQRLGDFKVYRGGERTFVFASAHRNWDSPRLSTFAEFDPETGKLDSVTHPDGISEQWTRAQVKTFVKSL